MLVWLRVDADGDLTFGDRIDKNASFEYGYRHGVMRMPDHPILHRYSQYGHCSLKSDLGRSHLYLGAQSWYQPSGSRSLLDGSSGREATLEIHEVAYTNSGATLLLLSLFRAERSGRPWGTMARL
jgi:hypothetical protein